MYIRWTGIISSSVISVELKNWFSIEFSIFICVSLLGLNQSPTSVRQSDGSNEAALTVSLVGCHRWLAAQQITVQNKQSAVNARSWLSGSVEYSTVQSTFDLEPLQQYTLVDTVKHCWNISQCHTSATNNWQIFAQTLNRVVVLIRWLVTDMQLVVSSSAKRPDQSCL